MKYQMIRGFPFPHAPWFTKKNIEDAMDYVPHDNDIIIASYPKTGTTWLQYIVFQIVSKGELFPSFGDNVFKLAPYIEMTGTDIVDQMSPPRMYKHHIPYNMMQKNPKAKTVYIYRKPDDTCVSFFHFMSGLKLEVGTLEEFIEAFITGDIGYGLYFNNLLSYLESRNEPNLLLVSYEKLMKDRKEEILRIAQFLGEEYHQPLLEDGQLLTQIIERTSFDYMKKNLIMSFPDSKEPSTGNEPTSNEQLTPVNFFRKGVVGDGKNVFSSDQLQRLQNVAKEMLKNYDSVLKDWFAD